MTAGAGSPGARSILEPGAVDVWLIDVDDPGFLGTAALRLATGEDEARAARMTDPAAATRLLARRATLRLILSRYVGAPPDRLRIVTAPGGKPVLTHGPAISIAHSGSVYAVAVAAGSSVGVDVEQIRTVARAPAIAERWFEADEAAALAAVPEEGLAHEFLRLWTAKEALAKRHGAGLRLMKGRGEGSGGALDVRVETDAGRLRRFDVGEGYLGAVAATGPITSVRPIRPGEDLWTI